MPRARRKAGLMNPLCCYCRKPWPFLPEGVDAQITPCPGCARERRKLAQAHFAGNDYRTTPDGSYILSVPRKHGEPDVAKLPFDALTYEQQWARMGFYTEWNDTARAYYVASCTNLEDTFCPHILDVVAWISTRGGGPEGSLNLPLLPKGVHLSSLTGERHIMRAADEWSVLVTGFHRRDASHAHAHFALWQPTDVLRVVKLMKGRYRALLLRTPKGWDLYVHTARKVDWLISGCPKLERVWPVAMEELVGTGFSQTGNTRLTRLRYDAHPLEEE